MWTQPRSYRHCDILKEISQFRDSTHHTWCAEIGIRAVVAGCGIHLQVADAVPVWTRLVAHAAVGDGVADSACCVAGKTGGTVLVSAAPVSVADSVVTDLGR